MDHEFSEAQQLLRRSAADFFNRDYPLDRFREIYAASPGYDPALWRSLVEMGWPAAPFPEAAGGFGGGLVDAGLLLEQMGKAACVSPYNHSTCAAGLALLECEPELAAAVAAGDAVVIPAIGRSAGAGVQLDRRSSSDEDAAAEVACSGTASYVPWAEVATHFLLPLGQGEAVLIAAGQAGIAAQRLETLGGDPLYAVQFTGVRGRVVGGAALLDRVLLLGAAANALLLLGLAERALELAVTYAKDRVQFGKPIGSFQAIQHRCADMAIAIEVGRHLAYKAAWLHADGRPIDLAARYAKAYLSDVAGYVTRQTLQIHGGVGFIDHHRAQLMYTIATATTAAYGTAREHRAAISRHLLAGGGIEELDHGLRIL